MWGGARYCGFSNFNSRDKCLVCEAPKGFVGKLKPMRDGTPDDAATGGEESRLPPSKSPPAPKRRMGAKGQEQDQEEAGKGGEPKSAVEQDPEDEELRTLLQKLVEQDPEDEELQTLWENA